MLFYFPTRLLSLVSINLRYLYKRNAKTEKQYLCFQKYPDKCGQGLTLLF